MRAGADPYVHYDGRTAVDPNPSPNPNPASVVTGTRAATLCGADGTTPLDWKDAMDDTCESFGMRDLFEGNVRRKHA